MKMFHRALALCLIACMLLPCLALGEALAFALKEDLPEQSTEATFAIPFTGEEGVSYSLHAKHGGIWQLPVTQALVGTTEGEFTVELKPGMNDFVLVEMGQPRDGETAITFTVEYVTDEVAAPPLVSSLQTETPEATPTETATASASPEATTTPTPEPTAESTPEPTPEPTATPEPSPSPEPTEEAAEPTPTPEPTPDMGQDRLLSLWMRGEDVKALQDGLEGLGFKFGRADGIYGPRTRAAVMRFQRKHGVKIDGLVGEQTREKLKELGVEIPLYFEPDQTLPEGFDRILSTGMRGMDVNSLQEALIENGFLKGNPDQIFGAHTRRAVQKLQRENGLKVDGVAGPDTLRLLFE